MKYFLFIILVFVALILNGCVTMTRRDFELFKQGWRSVGYMEGLGENNRVWMHTVDGLDIELALCRDRLALVEPKETAVPGTQGKTK